MPRFIIHFCTILFLITLGTSGAAEPTAPAPLPLTVQLEGTNLVFVAQPQVSGVRAMLYDAQGKTVAESGSWAEAPPRWIVPTTGGAPLPQGTYLAVFWVRGQGSTTKRIGHLQLATTGPVLQSAEDVLRALEPAENLSWGSPQHRAAVRRAYQQGEAVLPFFRLATKALAEDTSAHLLLIRALQIKYSQTTRVFLAPPPPPPPPPPPGAKQRRGGTRPTRAKVDEFTLPQPTPEERQELLAAGKKAVALGKTCAEKNYALQWLADVQEQLNEQAARLTTLEELGSATCASPTTRAQSWYAIGVSNWQCAYEVTTRYADPKRAEAEPFHFRQLKNPADQQQAATCLQRGLQAIEKSLAFEPDASNTWSYRSLLLREQQKLTADPAEAQKLATAATEAAQRAVELARKQPAR